MADLAALTQAIEAGDRTTAAALTQKAVDQGIDPRTVLAAMTVAMDAVGRVFQRNEIFVPEADRHIRCRVARLLTKPPVERAA